MAIARHTRMLAIAAVRTVVQKITPRFHSLCGGYDRSAPYATAHMHYMCKFIPVSSGKGNGNGPHRHHHGEVEGADARDHAQRLTDVVTRDATAHFQSTTLTQWKR